MFSITLKVWLLTPHRLFLKDIVDFRAGRTISCKTQAGGIQILWPEPIYSNCRTIMGCEWLMNDCNLYWSVPGALSSVVLRPHTVKKERAYHFSQWRGDHFHTSLGSRFPKAALCPLLICCFSCRSGFSSTSTALQAVGVFFHATARWIMLQGGLTHNVLLFYSQVFFVFFFF